MLLFKDTLSNSVIVAPVSVVVVMEMNKRCLFWNDLLTSVVYRLWYSKIAWTIGYYVGEK